MCPERADDQIGVIAGNCAGGAAYSPALMDFLVMTRENANMFICGPQVIKAATGVDCTMSEIGSATACLRNDVVPLTSSRTAMAMVAPSPHPSNGGPPNGGVGVGAAPPMATPVPLVGAAGAEYARKMRDHHTLSQIITQWNANRLDLFALSLPNEVG